eukprot:1160429-Pelagomonas_calceolata.AAC.11
MSAKGPSLHPAGLQGASKLFLPVDMYSLTSRSGKDFLPPRIKGYQYNPSQQRPEPQRFRFSTWSAAVELHQFCSEATPTPVSTDPFVLSVRGQGEVLVLLKIRDLCRGATDRLLAEFLQIELNDAPGFPPSGIDDIPTVPSHVSL